MGAIPKERIKKTRFRIIISMKGKLQNLNEGGQDEGLGETSPFRLHDH
jgi:hypothetical protein